MLTAVGRGSSKTRDLKCQDHTTKELAYNKCPILIPASPHRPPSFGPKGHAFPQPRPAAWASIRPTSRGPTARPFAVGPSDSSNGRPFKPGDSEGLANQGRWPWRLDLSGPWGLKQDTLCSSDPKLQYSHDPKLGESRFRGCAPSGMERTNHDPTVTDRTWNRIVPDCGLAAVQQHLKNGAVRGLSR